MESEPHGGTLLIPIEEQLLGENSSLEQIWYTLLHTMVTDGTNLTHV